MAGNITKRPFSGSTNGRLVKLTGNSSGGAVTVHTAVSGTASNDEIWLYAMNDSTSPEVVTIEFGGTTDVNDTIKKTIPPKGTEGSDGLNIVIPGLILQNGLVVKAFASTVNVITLSGYVNRIT